MGLFDRFKKNKEEKESNNIDNYSRNANDIRFYHTHDKKLAIEFEEYDADFKQFYDTTRVIIDSIPSFINNSAVYGCKVSWYDSQDAQIFDNDGNDISRRTDYNDVLAQIDPVRMQQDLAYCEYVMKKLFEKSRVEKYLAQGLSDNPSNPCGNYVGGVKDKGNGTFGKFFDLSIGQIVHSSQYMIDKRMEFERKERDRKNRAIEEKHAQIRKLRGEIDNLSK